MPEGHGGHRNWNPFPHPEDGQKKNIWNLSSPDPQPNQGGANITDGRDWSVGAWTSWTSRAAWTAEQRRCDANSGPTCGADHPPSRSRDPAYGGGALKQAGFLKAWWQGTKGQLRRGPRSNKALQRVKVDGPVANQINMEREETHRIRCAKSEEALAMKEKIESHAPWNNSVEINLKKPR